MGPTGVLSVRFQYILCKRGDEIDLIVRTADQELAVY